MIQPGENLLTGERRDGQIDRWWADRQMSNVEKRIFCIFC